MRADPTNLRESTFSGPVSGPRRGETGPDFVRRAAARRRWCWVVAPESEGLLAELAEAVAPRDWVGCTHAAIALCSSKRRTLLRLAAHGVATPLAFAREADDAQSRWVVKPDDGAGTVHTQRHATRERAEADLAQRLARGASATLEPWVEGEALSLSLLCGPHGAELLAVNRQHIVADAEGHLCDEGVLVGAVAPHDPRRAALADLSRAVHAAIGGLFGFVGVDLVWHPARGPVAVEVNPRLTCAYVGLSQALGRNLAGEILALHEAKVLHVQH